MKKIKHFAVIPFTICVFILIRPYFIQTEFPKVKNEAIQGVVDLTKQNLEQTIVELSGTVASYPNKLLRHEDFLTSFDKTEKSRVWTKLPTSWKTNEGVHYATQRFLIRGLEAGSEYGIQTMDALTAFQIFVNGKLIIKNGVVSTNSKEARPEANPGIGLFTAESNEVELVFQVSNFESNRTGLWQKIYFGTEKNIIQYQQELERIDTFIFSTCLIMANYHWILFLIMRKDKATLFFAAFCTLVSIKVALSGQQLGFVWYSQLTYDIGVRLAYLTIPWITIFCILFAQKCFPQKTHPSFVKISLFLAGAQSLVILFARQSFYQETFLGYQVYIVIVCIILTHWIVRAVMDGKEGAVIYLLGFLTLFAAAINDILYSMLLVKTGYILGIGLFALILAQSSIIAIRVFNFILKEENMRNNLELLVEERTMQLKHEKELFEHLSKVDGLTHIYNKRYLTEALEIELESYERYGDVFSVIMADIDYFKKVNDQYGHLVGDEVLLVFSRILQRNTRKADIVGRFGGEEFLVIMRHTGLEEAIIHAENLRRCVDDARIETKAGMLHITSSFGVATINEGVVDEIEILKAVDDALYTAKTNGRNRVEPHTAVKVNIAENKTQQE